MFQRENLSLETSWDEEQRQGAEIIEKKLWLDQSFVERRWDGMGLGEGERSMTISAGDVKGKTACFSLVPFSARSLRKRTPLSVITGSGSTLQKRKRSKCQVGYCPRVCISLDDHVRSGPYFYISMRTFFLVFTVRVHVL